ncbi:Glucosamine-phosphate N-acetyltransferase-like protein [Entomophthora muscae]|nr:Glucosamine-phosphate N-acetyltransferase-like protein [Entomophthora muscae]
MTQLFSPSLISDSVQRELPEGLVMRPLEPEDLDKGFFECLSQLTVAHRVPKERFAEVFKELQSRASTYTLVIEDTKAAKIVGAGTLLLEQKFVRSCGKAGHIEDIVVHDSQRGRKLGLRIIDALKHIGIKLQCYKIILNCSESNIKFYEKCGLKLKDFQMVLYPPETQPFSAVNRSQL